MSKRIASFEATYTTSINVPSVIKELEETYRVQVGNADVVVGIYTWDFTYIDDQYNAIVTEIGNSTIIDMQIMFKYNNNDDGIKISFRKYDGPNPKLEANEAVILAGVTSNELGTADILSTNKTGLTTDLDDVDTFYYESLLNIVSREFITVGIVRHTDLSTSTGTVELSGQNLVGGSSEWRSSADTEPIDPPLLVITYDVTTESFPRLNMKFTTSDPTTAQSTPSNSLGEYLALNDVAPSSPINESINSVQTTIPINADFALPTKIGLGSVGPEIFQYSIIDTTNHQLAGVVRGIAPNAFPAGFDSFKNAENVYYLATDSNDLHLLFDTRPASDLVQYRCVAIANVDSGDDFNIKEGVIGIAQDSGSDVEMVIGVELPRWDSITGVAVDGASNTGEALLVTSDSGVILKADGYYDGALLKITSPSGAVSYTIADSFATDGATGEFTISPTISGLVATWNFVIMPAPAQQIANDATAPTTISERFSGFSEDVEGIAVQLLDHGTTMQENDLFYVWIRRTLPANTEATSDTGAVLIFRYRDV